MYEEWFSAAAIVWVLTFLFVSGKEWMISLNILAGSCFVIGILDLYGLIAVGGK